MKKLTLYYKPTCPFCLKALNYLKQKDIEIALKDINTKSEYRQELQDIGGKTQVPCLVIDGKPLYESNDIIKWFEENYKSA